MFDVTPPQVGQVRDGPPPGTAAPAFDASLAAERRRLGVGDSAVVDLDYQTSLLSMWVTFDGWADAETGITGYEWGIGTVADPTATVADLSLAPLNVMELRPVTGGAGATTAAASGLPLQVCWGGGCPMFARVALFTSDPCPPPVAYRTECTTARTCVRETTRCCMHTRAQTVC